MNRFGKTPAKSTRIACALGGFIIIGAATVIACGPDFPMQLLDDRAGTLKNTPANSFAWEAAHLLAATDKLRADENAGWDGQREDDPNSLRMREKGTLDDAGLARLKAMRAQPDGDAAYAAGDGLPPAVRLYTAGAQDYRAARADGQPQADALDERARKRFEAVLALPPQEAAARSVWAAYMLGQQHAAVMDPAQRRQAIARFEQVRQLARDGAADPLALAVTSFGEQARLFLHANGQPCDWTDFEGDKACAAGVAPADLKRAIRLYAEQAARGSGSAVSSLRTIAYWALADADRAAPLLDDPVAAKLLVAYALARMGDIVDGSADSVYTFEPGSGGGSGYADAARGEFGRAGLKITPNPILASLVDALQRRGLERIEGADRVAALAYRTGRYELANKLAQKQDSALAWWVRAKLALRAGDSVGAAQAYSRALKGFPHNDASLESASASQLMGEQGVLTLSRGQYVDALDQFLQAARSSRDGNDEVYYSSAYGNYINDMLYVAERVLTTDELKRYVDAHAPASPMPDPAAVRKAASTQRGAMALNYAARGISPPTLEDRLRQLLARRLVREGKVEVALPYFPDERDDRFVDSAYDDNGKETPVTWRTRSKAREYGQALERAQHGWRATSRAEGWYRAAVIARRQGMEIMGYEQGPDFAEYGGNYPVGGGREGSPGFDDSWQDEATRKARPTTPLGRAQAALPGPFVTPEERVRYAGSEAAPYKRYHYRDIAAGYTLKAADELPPRSQAFAAVLCQGVNFVFYDAQRAPELYRRYVKEGAAVPFAADFGQNCVEPDFAAAARFPYVQAWRAGRAWVVQHRVASAAALLMAVLAVATGVAAYRRRRKSVE